MLRLMRWAITVAIVQGTMLLLLAQLIPGFSISADPMVLLVALIFTGTNFITWPLVYRLSVRIHPFLFPIVGIGLSGLMVYLVSKLLIFFGIHTLRFDNVQTGVAITFGLSVSYTLFAGLFSLRDVDAYDWFVIDRLRRTFPQDAGDSSTGTIFIEIDGLATPHLQRAIDEGWMPNLARWQADGTHVLNGWETDLSSQTSASQAGILLGSNRNIPAFRWYDKPRQQLMVSSSVTTARTLEHDLSNGNGLLQAGASRWNIFSGDAPDSLLTYSTIGVKTHGSTREYLTLWASPFLIMRTVALFIGDVFRERWQAWRQRRDDARPRMKRTFRYALVRAATTTIMLELAQFMLLADMYRGIQTVYCTIFAYDEVAHHSGIERVDALKVLNRIDQSLGTLAREREHAARPYHFVILSDHGQSQGPTFRQRNGQTLGELVKSLISAESSVLIHDALVEDQAHIRLSLQQALVTTDSTRSLRLIQNALKYLPHQEADTSDLDLAGKPSADDVLVMASGNLGLISFPKYPDRMTIEEINKQFPLLITGLLSNEDIGFIMVRTEEDGTIAMGRAGIHYLDSSEVFESDPLTHYGLLAADHLRRTDGFDNAPDILVMSAYDAERGEVYAFEELIGSHGGLGGTQTQPFVFHPVDYAYPKQSVVGAEALHDLLMGWITPAEHRIEPLDAGSNQIVTDSPTTVGPVPEPVPVER